MEFEHKSVLLDECLENLNIKENGIYIDGTLGGAGHSSEIYKRLGKEGLLLGIDQDDFALETSAKRLEDIGGKARFITQKGNFREIKAICERVGIEGADGILLDLGVSSHQLDEAERGFSYQKDAPLDMRMDRTRELDAMKIVNTCDEAEIGRIIRDYGEENWWARIASFIVKARSEKPIETTWQLVDIIKAAIPSSARRDGPHPAKRTFQALRIAVNDELGALQQVIGDAVSILKPGGRLCIITFHSLEDRIVKTEFQAKEKPCTCPRSFPVCICGKKPEVRVISRKPILPSEAELENNPRSRSAKLRVAERIQE
ncbi:MAG: 16S rRNA (cytosine(1402)-N(4))-methyltransferase RsmH [Clostridiales bacterium]|nr:16S rRNA (cytosine(1402)-N(4))-methyltransferase RsmH [Clostridiales bacterium]